MFTRRRYFPGIIEPYYEPTTDPYWNNVVLLALQTGTNGGTTFTDSRGRHVLAAGGSAQTSTAQSIGAYGSSGLYDGSTAYVYQSSGDSDFTYDGATAFTIEAWIRPDAVAATMNVVGCRETVSLGYGWNIDIFSNGTFWFVGNAGFGSPVSTITAGVWQHLAVVRSGGVDTLYHNGVCVASQASISITNYLGLRIGARLNDSAFFDGHIGPVRITNSVARYSGTTVGVSYFTPPTVFPTQ